jgi:glucarate dehydratase
MTRITDVRITPIAFRDPPLLNVAGVHQPWALRSIIEVETADGRVGLGESYGDLTTLADLASARPGLIGLDVFDLNGLERIVYQSVGTANSDPGATFPPNDDRRRAIAIAAFEVAMLDLQGQIAGRPLYEILGGAVRPKVPFSAYLFYKFARHAGDPGYPPGYLADDWGEAITHAQMVGQAQRMVRDYGFASLKLKGGVFQPEFEIETLRALRQAFPDMPLRIDPNGGWTVATTQRVMPRLDGLLEYLEDPAKTLAEMGDIARFAPMPLATNMVTVAFGHIPETIRRGAVQVILSDHHYWGGLRATQHLAMIARTFGLGVSMHSNSHLGISLAAMAHVAVTIPNLAYAADTHYPWQVDEVIEGGKLPIAGGDVTPPSGVGLGVRLDRKALAALHDTYHRCGIRVRDDATEMQKHDPHWKPGLPRF